MRTYSAAAVLLVVVLGAGCGTMATVRPLRTGESALAVSVGGPVANIAGMDIPFPYMVARYRYGVDDRLGLYAGGHITTIPFGVFGFDGGMSYLLFGQQGLVPATMVGGGIVGLIESGGPSRVFPELDLTASWLYGDRFLTYVGIQSMYQLNAAPYVVFAPGIGQEIRLGSRVTLTLEAKWYAPTEDTEPRNIDYRIPVGGKGAVGFVLGANWLSGGWYE